MSDQLGVNTNLAHLTDDFEMETFQDGTTTIYTINSKLVGKTLAHGTAKRRKGDPRLAEVGLSLAAARAHEEMARQLYKAAEVLQEKYAREQKEARTPKSWKNQVTARERAATKRKARLEYRLRKGIEEAEAGKTVDRGDFTE